MVRSTARLALMAAACMGFAGCAHRVKVAPPPPLPPPVAVPLVSAPEPAATPQVQKQPVPTVPLPTEAVQPKPKRSRKKAIDTTPAPVVIATPPPPPPGQLASTGGPPPPNSVIGSLTAGGDAAPAEKQRAADSIASVEKSLAGFGGSGSDEQREGLTRVRTFLRQAHEALNTGDAEGASTLATKAKVLLDDLMK